jgi:hypothetical protein
VFHPQRGWLGPWDLLSVHCFSLDTLFGTIDYRCGDGWSSLSAQPCQVPTPTSQNLKLERQIRISISTCLEQTNLSIAWKLNSRISTLCQYPTEKVISEKFGLAIDNPVRVLFFFDFPELALESQAHLWYPGVVSYPKMPRCHPTHPNLRIFSSIVASIVYGCYGHASRIGVFVWM